jgi:hypothetical protein
LALFHALPNPRLTSKEVCALTNDAPKNTRAAQERLYLAIDMCGLDRAREGMASNQAHRMEFV